MFREFLRFLLSLSKVVEKINDGTDEMTCPGNYPEGSFHHYFMTNENVQRRGWPLPFCGYLLVS